MDHDLTVGMLATTSEQFCACQAEAGKLTHSSGAETSAGQICRCTQAGEGTVLASEEG